MFKEIYVVLSQDIEDIYSIAESAHTSLAAALAAKQNYELLCNDGDIEFWVQRVELNEEEGY